MRKEKIRTLFHLPACPLPGMVLSRGNISEHFSRSTCPVRQSSVTIWRALWHKVMLSSVRTLMSLLLSHCTPEEPGGRRFIWAPFMRRWVQPVRGRQQGGALRPDPYPARNEQRSEWPDALAASQDQELESNPRCVHCASVWQ